jgi:hypothetical protein
MVYTQVNQGMYGLPQSGLLANKLLERQLNKRDYHQSKLVPGFWRHKWHTVLFTLVVDDFGMKYVREEHTLHLKQTFKENYKITLDWDGRQYIGITLDWDYKHRQVHLSMPGYIKKVLKHCAQNNINHTLAPSSNMVQKSKMPLHNQPHVRQILQKNHPTSVWQLSVFGTSGRQHTTVSHQCNSIASSKTNQRRN